MFLLKPSFRLVKISGSFFDMKLLSIKVITAFVLLGAIISIQGCAMKMNKDSDSGASFAPTPSFNAEDQTLSSDGRIISGMVAKTAFNGEEPLNWLNPETGNIGVISTVQEKDNEHCRTFRTSREAYDGVALYSGKICEVSPGVWDIKHLSQVDQ